MRAGRPSDPGGMSALLPVLAEPRLRTKLNNPDLHPNPVRPNRRSGEGAIGEIPFARKRQRCRPMGVTA